MRSMYKKIQSGPADISNILTVQGLGVVSEISESYTLAMGEHEDRKRIGAELRRKRRVLRWTQAELAERASTVRETILRVERGDPTVKPVTLDDVRLALESAEVAPGHNARLPGAQPLRAEKDVATLHAELARVTGELRRLRSEVKQFNRLRTDVYRIGTTMFKVIDRYNLEPPELPAKHRKTGR